MQSRANVTTAVEVSSQRSPFLICQHKKTNHKCLKLQDQLRILNDLLLDDEDARNTVGVLCFWPQKVNYHNDIIISQICV